MNKAYLLTGANLGDRKNNLSIAAKEITIQCGALVACSAIYETSAWGFTEQPSFYNQALIIETQFSARQLMRKLLRIEKQMGRLREKKYGPRIIDIDILLFNDEVHNYALLRVPHPEMTNRRFALLPLNEIEPLLIHPVLKKNIQTLLAECQDPLEVKKLAK